RTTGPRLSLSLRRCERFPVRLRVDYRWLRAVRVAAAGLQCAAPDRGRRRRQFLPVASAAPRPFGRTSLAAREKERDEATQEADQGASAHRSLAGLPPKIFPEAIHGYRRLPRCLLRRPRERPSRLRCRDR